jgi:hypothetical protein
MKILKAVLAIVTGYAIFVISAIALFQLSGVDPHAEPSAMFMILSIVYGILFSVIGGITTRMISKSGTLTTNYILAGIIACFAAFSMVKTSGNHYSQWAAIFLFAPASILGGFIYGNKSKKG